MLFPPRQLATPSHEDVLKRLRTLRQFVHEHPDAFCSPEGARWFIRHHRDELVNAGALYRHCGQLKLDPEPFIGVVLSHALSAAATNPRRRTSDNIGPQVPAPTVGPPSPEFTVATLGLDSAPAEACAREFNVSNPHEQRGTPQGSGDLLSVEASQA